MRALVFTAPGNLRLTDDAPVPQSKEGQLLVRCTHAGLCGSNMGPYLGEGMWAEAERPSVPGWTGHENVGTVEESHCPELPTGTLVLAQDIGHCGFAEYILATPRTTALLPVDCSDPGAFVLAQPLATVLRAVAKLESPMGRSCAVVGQGPIGLMFTFVLRQLGAARVIAIDRVGWRLEWALRLGATDAVDASQVDPVETVRGLTGGAGVALSVEAATTASALVTAALILRAGGCLMPFGVPRRPRQEFPWHQALFNETRVVISHGPGCHDYFQIAVDLLAGKYSDLQRIVTPRLPWERAAEAFASYADPDANPGSLKTVLNL